MYHVFEKLYKREKKQVGIGSVLILLVFLCFLLGSYIMIYRPCTEPFLDWFNTNEDAVLYSLEEQKAVLKGFEQLYKLTFETHLSERDYGTIPIPGMRTTRTFDVNNPGQICVCTSMTPQGLCVAKDYLLVSAYCHTQRHNSVIYVLNKKTHRFVKELILEGHEHVGGLAYDPIHDNIWVSTNRNGNASASSFSMKQLKQYSIEKDMEPLTYQYETALPGLERNSFITYADGYLYAGRFSENGESIVRKYLINMQGELSYDIWNEKKHRVESDLVYDGMMKIKNVVPNRIIKVPKCTQGFAIYKNKVLIAQSYGMAKSELLVYHYMDTTKELNGKTLTQKITMPQKLQQIYVDGTELYLLFESAAYAYRAQPLPKVDRILKLDLEHI